MNKSKVPENGLPSGAKIREIKKRPVLWGAHIYEACGYAVSTAWRFSLMRALLPLRSRW